MALTLIVTQVAAPVQYVILISDTSVVVAKMPATDDQLEERVDWHRNRKP